MEGGERWGRENRIEGGEEKYGMNARRLSCWTPPSSNTIVDDSSQFSQQLNYVALYKGGKIVAILQQKCIFVTLTKEH